MHTMAVCLRRTLTGVLAVGCATIVAAAQSPPGMRGEQEAIAMARTMMDRMGDRKLWSQSTTLHIVEEVHRASGTSPARSESWRLLREPSIWWQSVSDAGTRSFAYTQHQGWTSADGRITPASAFDVRQWQGRWPRNVYVMYHRLAREDSSLWLVRDGERRFLVLDANTGERLCSFEVSGAGDIVRWTASFGTDAEEWIYGPLKTFGRVRMPDWGVRLHDNYRFYYRSVELSASPPPVSFEPPSGVALRQERFIRGQMGDYRTSVPR
jgi:hypothetical protein